MECFPNFSGGQFRKETILPNGTVVGAYSWKDVKGRTRVYTYTADSRGYRITQHKLLAEDKKELVNNKEDLDIVKNLDNEVSNDLVEDQERDRDVRSHRNSKKLRLRRKVLVKRHRAGKAHPKSSKVKVKKLGKAAEIIPYQPTLLLRYMILYVSLYSSVWLRQELKESESLSVSLSSTKCSF